MFREKKHNSGNRAPNSKHSSMYSLVIKIPEFPFPTLQQVVFLAVLLDPLIQALHQNFKTCAKTLGEQENCNASNYN